jgi:lysophospholipase L1-like esterase
VPVGGADNACAGQPAGNVCIECLFGGTTYNTSETTPTAEATSEAGNYLVTVTLGGAAAGDTLVTAESSRGLLQSVTTTAGQALNYAFVVNARAMEGQPKHAGGPGGYSGLDLFFSGTNPQVTAIGYALATTATKPVMIYIASDSTTCDQTGGAFGGWGQMLPEYFAPPVGVANYANSGAASGDYGFWSDISSRWAAGDWFIIQFGHNDKTDTDATVEANLTPHVKAALAAGVNPIMVSPPARLQGIPIPSQTSLHAAAAQAVATANNIPYIDLTALSTAWYDGLGMTQQQALKAYHANGTDATHTSLPGAEKLAGLVAKAIKDQNIGLAKYLR